MKYRPKDCMMCGGKAKPIFQEGGCFDAIGNPIPCAGQQLQDNKIPGYSFTRSIDTQDRLMLEAQRLKQMNTADPALTTRIQQEGTNGYTVNPIHKKNNGEWAINKDSKIDPFKVGLGVQSVTTGLSWLSGVMDRRRQNRYLRSNLSTLGSIEAQPFENFQPNPYNTYAKLGGNIKKHMYTNDAHNNAIDETNARMQMGGSIVDYLNEQGQQSSFKSRKQRFIEKYGTEERYRGTAQQNLRLLDQLKHPSVEVAEATEVNNQPQSDQQRVFRPRQQSITQPVRQKKQTITENTPLVVADGKRHDVTPVFNDATDRFNYLKLLKQTGEDLGKTTTDEGLALINPFSDKSGYCINNVTGVMEKCGIKYSNPQMNSRYIGNAKFIGNVQNKMEDFYQASSPKVGDHVIYSHDKTPGAHSKVIYDEYVKDGKKMFKLLTGSTKQGVDSQDISEEDIVKAMHGDHAAARGYDRINIFRPGYALDKQKLEDQRSNQETKELINFETGQTSNFKYKVRDDYKGDVTKGMEKFMDYANNEENVNQLVKNFGVSKAEVHDELLNVMGELMVENKGRKAPVTGVGLGTLAENLYERTFKPKDKSIGPGQIRFDNLDESLKKMYNIKKPKDLYDWDKVIPLMAAMNIRNRQWMKNQGENLSDKLIGIPGVSANNIKGGVGRWTPYAYNGLPNIERTLARESKAEQKASQSSQWRMGENSRKPTSFKYDEWETKEYIDRNIGERALLNEHGSYPDKVFHAANEIIERTSPTFMDEKGLQPAVVKSNITEVLFKASAEGNRELVNKIYKNYPDMKRKHPGLKKGGRFKYVL